MASFRSFSNGINSGFSSDETLAFGIQKNRHWLVFFSGFIAIVVTLW
jgi:hypothetical protein